MVKYHMDRLEELAEALETQETAKGLMFDMSYFHGVVDRLKWQAESEKLEKGEVDDHPYCGTAGCIGGWIKAIFGNSKESGWSEAGAFALVTIPEEGDESNDALSYNGNDTPMHILFYPPFPDNWGWITKDVAAEAVREFMATETVDWLALKEKHVPVVETSG